MDCDPAFLVLRVQATRSPKDRSILVVRTQEGDVSIAREPLAWVTAQLWHNNTDAHGLMTTIGRLYEYTAVAFGDIEITAETLPRVVWNYVAFRVGQRIHDAPDTVKLSHWQPIREDTAISEYRAIVSYIRFCNDKYKTLPLLKKPEPARNFHAFDVATSSKRDFFQHVRAQREYWQAILGIARDRRPNVTPAPKTIQVRSAQGQTMSRDEVDLIIGAEKNPVLRAIWLLCAYGGIRISEALNIWCIDVMPGAAIDRFEPGAAQNTPLVVLAHPRLSRFTGDFSDTSLQRNEFLQTRYGLVPRSDLPKRHPMRAGWKGVTINNHRLGVSWVYWLYPGPSFEFLNLVATMLRCRKGMPGAAAHPYLFINHKLGKHQGAPLKYKNVAKAFERACERVNLEPHVAGHNIHGFRHFFEATLEHTFKFKPEEVQAMMHHKSVTSQRDYGHPKVADIHGALSRAYSRGGECR